MGKMSSRMWYRRHRQTIYHRSNQKQSNRCVYSGIEFDWDKFQNNPYQASIDRIDNDKGYIKGNVQIVCNIINQMKSNLSDPVFYDYVNSIHEHRCI